MGKRVDCFLKVLLGLLLTACATRPRIKSITDLRPTVLLISLDGFRADYWDRYHLPCLTELAEQGVRVRQLEPVFPALTFPNHYSLATGLYPEQHGILSNAMKDPAIAGVFTLSDQSVVRDPRWWGGEPIWNTVLKQGQISATLFWPGSDVAVGGMKATYWSYYDPKVLAESRVDKILEWIDKPVNERPTFMGVYFESPDLEGHLFGPESPEVGAAVTRLDRSLGRLFEGLKTRGIDRQIHIIVVSDHGMVNVRPDHLIALPGTDFAMLGHGAYVGIYPKARESLKKIERRLRHFHPHMRVYRPSQLPASFHHSHSRRLPPLIALADEGWYLFDPAVSKKEVRGAHGYDPRLVSMQAFLVARGPRFKEHFVQDHLSAVDLYSLLCEILGLQPAPHAGNRARTASLLR